MIKLLGNHPEFEDVEDMRGLGDREFRTVVLLE